MRLFARPAFRLRRWNDYATEFNAHDPARLAVLPVLPTHSPEAAAAELERVAVAADMRQMQFGRAAHDVRKGRTIAGLDPRSDCLDLRKELRVAQQRHMADAFEGQMLGAVEP